MTYTLKLLARQALNISRVFSKYESLCTRSSNTFNPTSTFHRGLSRRHASTALKVNSSRLWDTIHETSKFGDSKDGGIKRLTLTDDDKKVRDWLLDAAEALGCSVKIDQMGNIFAIRAGSKNDLPPIAMGSHLDTQPAGGRFDGILGVLGGLEVLRVLHEQNYQSHAPIAVVNWTNEEGARYNSGMLGSSVWAGMISQEEAYTLKDIDGKTFGNELSRVGYKGTEVATARANPLSAHFELHIEQGPVLEDDQKELGVVTGVQAMGWVYVVVEGRCQHCGTTPMDRRADALLAATKIIPQINALALEVGGMSTVGVFQSEPSSPGTIPGRVRFSVDLEHLDNDTRDLMVRKTKEICSTTAAGEGCQVSFENTWDSRGVRFDKGCIDTVRAAAIDLVGEDGYVELPAGAGHDSVNTSYHCPTSMIFIPSKGGVSHHPSEWSSTEQCTLGVQALLDTVVRYDQKLSQG